MERCIVCFGFIAAGKDNLDRRMTKDDLSMLAQAVKIDSRSRKTGAGTVPGKDQVGRLLSTPNKDVMLLAL